MANVLGELFSEIAGSIRSGLGDIGAMKPSNFPDRIDELVAVMNALANGSGGDGGEEGGVATGETKVETGNFDTANTGVGRQYIRHTLGEIPDFVIVYALNMYSSGMDFSKNNFVAAWSVKSDLYSGGVKGSIMNTDSGSTMLGGLDVAIDNESVDLLSARIYCPDDSTIRVGTDKTDYGGQFGENTQYAWVAVSGMKKSVGSSADVRYVTFMSYDGTVEYGKKAVAVGDDCADPIARGVFAKPTRESDPQYNYTFYRWANEANGGADENWNKSITEDKTVYANFSAAVRHYTITYYDSDGSTVLKTESLAYGDMPSYKPIKENYVVGGWVPEITSVTGNASYTVVWEEKPSFASSSWANISTIRKAGNANEYFKVGDKRPITLTYTDGTSETINFTIVHILDGAKGICVMADNAVKKSLRPSSSSSSSICFNLNNNVNAFYEELGKALPSDLYAVLMNTTVYEDWDSFIFQTAKVRIPTQTQLTGTTTHYDGYDNGEDHHYPAVHFDYFKNGASIKRTKLNDDTADDYWTASTYNVYGGTYYYHYVDGTKISQHATSQTHGVVPYFMI